MAFLFQAKNFLIGIGVTTLLCAALILALRIALMASKPFSCFLF